MMSALRSLHRGFSLIEVLAAMAVLVLLMLLVVQIMNGANTATGSSRSRVSADSEARMVLDRIADDLANIVNRKDVDFVFDKTGGNDAAYFFSEAPAITPAAGVAQPVALIGYRINAEYQLERFGKGLTWNDAPPEGALFLAFPAASPSPAPSPTPLPTSTLTGAGSPFANLLDPNSVDAAYHVLGENVFRLEFTFLLKPYSDGTGFHPAQYSAVPYRDATHTREPITSDTGTFTNDLGVGLSDVQAVIVTLALMDGKSRALLDQVDPTAALRGLAAKFSDSNRDNLQSATPKLPGKTWQDTILAGGLGIKKAAAQQVRVYQRVFFLKSAVN